MLFVIYLVNIIYYVIVILLFARIILSFVRIGSYQLNDLVYRLTEPMLAPVRNILPPMGGFDFSPMIVLIAAEVLRRLIFSIII